MPCISVIVPTYNVLPYLDRSMTSLLGQTHRDLDILLIDDGATDGCAARCDAYARQDPRVRVVHQPNGGLSAARNTGLDHAVGDFVAFLDPDDYADPHMLERLLTTLTQAQADTCFCRYYDVSADGSVRLAPEDYARSLYTGAEIDQLLLGMVGSRPHHPHDVEIGMSVWKGLYSLPILRAHHIRFLSEREYLSEDLLFHLDYLAHAGAVAIVPEPLYYYCQNPASLTGVYRADRFAREKRFYEKVSAELALRFPPEVYRPRLDKAFLGRVRRCIAQEAAHNKTACGTSRPSAVILLCRLFSGSWMRASCPGSSGCSTGLSSTIVRSFVWGIPAQISPSAANSRAMPSSVTAGQMRSQHFSGCLSRWPCRR